MKLFKQLPAIILRWPITGRTKSIETTLIDIAIVKVVGIDKATLLQDQIIDVVIEVETMIVIGHLLDKTMLFIQEIAVKSEALESTLPVKLPEVFTTMRILTTSI